MSRSPRSWALVACLVAMTGCVVTPIAPSGHPKATASHGDADPSAAPSTGPSKAASPAATPSAGSGTLGGVLPSPSATASAGAIATYTGRVLDLQHKPAANVLVRAFIVSDQGAGIVSDQGAGIVSDQGAGVIANNGGNVVSDHASGIVTDAGAGLAGTTRARHLLADTGLEAHTDADGHFSISDPKGRPLNVEAVQSDDLKAIKLNVAKGATDVELQLDHTGSITGHVTAPAAPTVKNFEGVDVFIPGTSYVGKAAADGSYTLDHVPVGTFKLVASKDGLGRAEQPNVQVQPQKATSAPDLALSVTAPAITAIDPPAGAPGSTVTITGSHFGTSTGTPATVTFGGAAGTIVARKDDNTLTVKVPDGAASGDVIVTVGGVPGAARPFYVIKSLAVAPATPTQFLPGATQAFTATGTGFDGKPVPNVQVTWKVDGPAATVDATGKLTAVAPGNVTLTASLGTLTASAKLQVLASMARASTVALTGSALGAVGRIAADRAGTLYAIDQGHLVTISPAGVVSFLAGGNSGMVDGTGAAAGFSGLGGIAFDPNGRVVLADTNNNAVRAVTPAGVVSTLAGINPPKMGGGFVNGAGAQAQFAFPSDVAVAADGAVFVADDINYAVRKVATDNSVSTLVGFDKGGVTFNRLHGLTIDSAGTLYLVDQNRIMTISPTGQASLLAGSFNNGIVDGAGADARFDTPGDLAVDGTKTLFVADTNNHVIRAIDLADPTHPVRTIAGDGTQGEADGLGLAARFDTPFGLALVAGANGPVLYVSDAGSNKLRKLEFVTKP